MNYRNRIMNLHTYAADRGYWQRLAKMISRHDAAEIVLEAEREIEQLENEVADWHAWAMFAKEEIQSLEIDNKRLREALSYAASMPMTETLRAAGITEGIVEAMQKEWLSKAPKHYTETLIGANRNE